MVLFADEPSRDSESYTGEFGSGMRRRLKKPFEMRAVQDYAGFSFRYSTISNEKMARRFGNQDDAAHPG